MLAIIIICRGVRLNNGIAHFVCGSQPPLLENPVSAPESISIEITRNNIHHGAFFLESKLHGLRV